MTKGGELHTRLRAARERSEMTQAELAERSGIAVNTIKQYESGRIKPGADALAGYAQAGINVMYLLLGEGSPLRAEGDRYAMGRPTAPMFISEGDGAHREVPLPRATAVMYAVVAGIDQCLVELGLSLGDAKKAELASALFEEFIETGVAPRPATILRFVKAAA